MKLNFLAAASLLCLSLTPATGYTSPMETPIVVDVTSEVSLLPVYIAPFQDVASGKTHTHISELEKILTFDMTNDGDTYIVPHTPQRIKLAKESEKNALKDSWSKEGVSHLIKVNIHKNHLACDLHFLANNSIKRIESLPLTGNLTEDRQQIHLLANALHKGLYGVDGIATTHILYTRKHKQGDKWLSEIWESDYDGENRRKLSQSSTGYAMTPVYLPPAAKNRPAGYLFVAYKESTPKIYISAFKDDLERRLLSLKGSQIMPAISKQRDHIAFISDASGNPDLFLQPFHPDKGAYGKPRQIFAHFGAAQASPSFSPDGQSLAFVSNKDGSPRIYVLDIPPPDMKLKDVKLKLISRANRESSAPAWSPDGTKLAYCARQGDYRQIWLYDFTSNREWQLTKGRGNKENPSWAPNSLHVVYNTSDAGASELYVINIKQKKEILIPSLPGEKRFPSWEPLNRN
jgi:TolB protein